jgi:hypothetical protein
VTTLKQVLALLTAFAFGAFVVYVVYDIMSHRPRAYPEEWGVVVVHFGSGARLWGLFESKADCLKARTVYREVYGLMAEAGDDAKKESRTLILKSGDERIPVTFSCLPLSEIRGLALDHDRPPK